MDGAKSKSNARADHISVPARAMVVAYDVSDDARRVRVATALAAMGDRAQRSVFVVRGSQRSLDRLATEVRDLVEGGDALLSAQLCASCAGRMRVTVPPSAAPHAAGDDGWWAVV